MVSRPSHQQITHMTTYTPETIPPIPSRVMATPTVAGLLPQVVSAAINELLKKASWSPAHVFTYNAVTDVYMSDDYYRDFCQVAADTVTFFIRESRDINTAISQAIQRIPGLYVGKVISMHPHIKSVVAPKLIDASIQNLSTLNDIQNVAAIERQKTNSNQIPQIQSGASAMNTNQPQIINTNQGQMVLFNGQYYTMQQWQMMQQQQQQQQFGMMPQAGMAPQANIPNIANVAPAMQQSPMMVTAPNGQQMVHVNGQYYTIQQWQMMQQQQQQQFGMMPQAGMVSVGNPMMNTNPFNSQIGVGSNSFNAFSGAIPANPTQSFGTPTVATPQQQQSSYFSPWDTEPHVPQQQPQSPAPLNNLSESTYQVNDFAWNTMQPDATPPQLEEVTFPATPAPNVHSDNGPASAMADTRIPDVYGQPFKMEKQVRPIHKTLINLEEYTRVWDIAGKEYIVKKEDLVNRDDHTIPLLGGTVELNVESRRKSFEREINNASKMTLPKLEEVRSLVEAKEEDITEEGKDLLAQARINFLLEEEVVGSVNALVTSLQAEQSKTKGMVMTGTAYVVHSMATREDNTPLWHNLKKSTSLSDLADNMKALAKALDIKRNEEKIKASDYVDSMIWLDGIDKHFTKMLNEFFVVQFNDPGIKVDSFMSDYAEAHQYVMSNMSEVFRSIWTRFDRSVISRLKSNDGMEDVAEYIKSFSAANGNATFSCYTEHVSVTTLNVLYAELGISIERPLAHRIDSERNAVLYGLAKTIFDNAETLKNGVDSALLVTHDGVYIKVHRGLLDTDNFMLSLA